MGASKTLAVDFFCDDALHPGHSVTGLVVRSVVRPTVKELWEQIVIIVQDCTESRVRANRNCSDPLVDTVVMQHNTGSDDSEHVRQGDAKRFPEDTPLPVQLAESSLNGYSYL